MAGDADSGGLGIVISADSHVMEPEDLWRRQLPAAFRDVAPTFKPLPKGPGFEHRPGGTNARERVKEMATDGVSAEVLYPTHCLRLFALQDPALQQACFRVYNDWLIEYCGAHPERLVGVPCISMYDVASGLKELERCLKAGLKGAMIWQSPPEGLRFTSEHYEPFWEACAALDVPVNLHILTGFNYSQNLVQSGMEMCRGASILKTHETLNSLFDLVFAGVFRRHPNLKLLNVESEIGWVPFYTQQWDHYYRRFHKTLSLAIDQEPSTYFLRHIWFTFFNDPVGAKMLGWWGADRCMWSSDYPHPNSTWPHSREVIQRDLGYLPLEAQRKLVRENVAKLFSMNIPQTEALAA